MKSILIIRPSAIGDIVMASPMIRVLRKAYPRAHLAWMVEPSLQDLLRHHPELDELILWPKAEWNLLLKQRRLISLGRKVTEFTRRMRNRRFDVALDAQGLLRSRGLAWLSGAHERIGFESKEPGRFLMTGIITRDPDDERMGSEYYLMMESLGLSPGGFHPEVALSREDERIGAELIGNLKLGGGYAVFSPFTTRPQKHWLEERWADLAGMIRKELGLTVVVLGGPGDVEAGRGLERRADGSIHSLSGKTTLGQGAAIIKGASLLVGVDTGLTHMGAAFDCPTVALFGATCPYLRTAGNKTRIVYERMRCSPCRRTPVCRGEFTCMKSIKSRQVFDEILGLFK